LDWKKRSGFNLGRALSNRRRSAGQTTAVREEITVKRSVLVALLVVGFATPAAAAKFYTTINTVGDCGMIQNPTPSAGMKRIGPDEGYDSREAARAALADNKDCKGIVE
jgi:hypothetical protein